MSQAIPASAKLNNPVLSILTYGIVSPLPLFRSPVVLLTVWVSFPTYFDIRKNVKKILQSFHLVVAFLAAGVGGLRQDEQKPQ